MKKKRILLPTLPIEIFQHIFVNLPVKSLGRFKAVCRQWNDLINEPHFVKMHFLHSKQQNNSHKLMIYSYPLHVYFSLDHQKINVDDDDIKAVKLQYPINDYNIPTPNITTIAGSVNGLVCIFAVSDNDNSSTTLVWNPTTKLHKVLPPHPDFPITRMHGIGFAYNSISNDYNVVRVVKGSRLDIYSLKTNSWKLVMHGQGIPTHLPRCQSRFRLSSLDGSIYWLACHTVPIRNGILKDLFLACLDLTEVDDDQKKKKNKLIREIPMPRDFDMKYDFAELKVMGECLSLFRMGICIKSLEIWSMMKINENKNDQVEYRWIKTLVIKRASFFMHAMCRKGNVPIYGIVVGVPICLSKDGKVLLRIPENTPSEFVLYDSDTERIENLHPIQWNNKKGVCMWSKVPIQESQMYIESLVSPNFMN